MSRVSCHICILPGRITRFQRFVIIGTDVNDSWNGLRQAASVAMSLCNSQNEVPSFLNWKAYIICNTSTIFEPILIAARLSQCFAETVRVRRHRTNATHIAAASGILVPFSFFRGARRSILVRRTAAFPCELLRRS